MPASTFLKSGKETRRIPVWFPKTKFPKARIPTVDYRADSFSETRFHRHQTFEIYPQADTDVR